MIMKKSLSLLVSMIGLGLGVMAQDAPVDNEGKFVVKGDASIQFTNSTFSTYQASGANNNANALLGKFNFGTDYKKGKHHWDNGLQLMYGVINQKFVVNDGNSNVYRRVTAKNADLISFTTKYGYELGHHLNLAALGNLQSQFAIGYKDPFVIAQNKQPTVISGFMAPAWINFGIGLDYKPNNDFSVYYSPLNSKITLVRTIGSLSDSLNQALRTSYSVIGDNNMRYELGSLLVASWRKELLKNIVYSTKISLFTNYLKNEQNPGVGRPGAIDVQLWSNSIAMQVNKYISATFTANVMYDEDTKFKILSENKKNGTVVVENGVTKTAPRTQYFHTLGVGLTYNFSNDKKKD
jgi:hypothetical protein